MRIEGHDFLLGRLTVNQVKENLWVEIDLVQKESKKIWAHVGDLYDESSLDEAISKSVWKLSDYLKK